MALECAATIPAIPRSPESAPTTFIIPGGTSDLVKTLILPELDKLVRLGRCSKTNFLFINRLDKGETDIQRTYLNTELKRQQGYNDRETSQLMQRIFAVECEDLIDKDKLETLFNRTRLDAVIHNMSQTRWLIHTALPPNIWGKMISQMPDLPNIEQVLLEKPVGTNLAEAQALITSVRATSYASKTRAIDHYLGKTLIDYLVKLKQNRNTDSSVAEEWSKALKVFLNPQYWQSVKIIMDEEKGVSERGSFFEEVGGIVPDMVQSHMFLTLASIEAVIGSPNQSDQQIADFLKQIKAQKVLSLAQYRGYLNHPGVKPDSNTPTGIKGQFIWQRENQAIPHQFRVAKGVNQKRGRIEIVFSEPIYSQADDTYIDSIHIRLHRRTIILLKRDINGVSQKEEITLVPDSVTDLGAYGNLYSGAIAGNNTATVSLDNVRLSHQIAAPFLEVTNIKPEQHPQGEVWGNF